VNNMGRAASARHISAGLSKAVRRPSLGLGGLFPRPDGAASSAS
jgi:hypothetical protein